MTQPRNTWDNVPAKGQLLRPKEVAKRTGLSRSQIYSMIADGKFPPFLKLSSRTSALPEVWLDAFIASRAKTTFQSEMQGANPAKT